MYSADGDLQNAIYIAICRGRVRAPTMEARRVNWGQHLHRYILVPDSRNPVWNHTTIPEAPRSVLLEHACWHRRLRSGRLGYHLEVPGPTKARLVALHSVSAWRLDDLLPGTTSCAIFTTTLGEPECEYSAIRSLDHSLDYLDSDRAYLDRCMARLRSQSKYLVPLVTKRRYRREIHPDCLYSSGTRCFRDIHHVVDQTASIQI